MTTTPKAKGSFSYLISKTWLSEAFSAPETIISASDNMLSFSLIHDGLLLYY